MPIKKGLIIAGLPRRKAPLLSFLVIYLLMMSSVQAAMSHIENDKRRVSPW